MTVAAVTLWGSRIAAVSIAAGARYATFQYDPSFARSGIEIAPVKMPLRVEPYTFAGLPQDAFSGLPGLLADALPDRWGTALVNAWLASQGREQSSFDVVQRLCYVGTRGMGALEFQPANEPTVSATDDLRVDALVRLASEVLAKRAEFVTELSRDPEEESMKAILAVGSSAGGARPKALIAYNEATGQVRSGQVEVGRGLPALAAEVRRGIARRRSRADRSAGMVRRGVRVLETGARRRHRHDRVPPAGRARPPALHDASLRPT